MSAMEELRQSRERIRAPFNTCRDDVKSITGGLAMEELRRANAWRDSLAAPSRALREAAKSITGGLAMEELRRADAWRDSLAAPSRALREAAKSITGGLAKDELRKANAEVDLLRDALVSPSRDLQNRMRELSEQFGPDSSFGRLAKRIQDQFEDHRRSIDDLGIPALPPKDFDLRINLPPIPPNPIHEVNDRLERIEQRFQQMLAVAETGAQIATGLQAHAADLLAKFEKAASDNDRAVKRTVNIGAIAIVVTVVMTVAQIVYTELWRVPRDSASTAGTIMELQSQITALRQTQIETQAEAADRIAAAVAGANQDMIEALRDALRKP